jgi:hypothetical protein
VDYGFAGALGESSANNGAFSKKIELRAISLFEHPCLQVQRIAMSTDTGRPFFCDGSPSLGTRRRI